MQRFWLAPIVNGLGECGEGPRFKLVLLTV